MSYLAKVKLISESGEVVIPKVAMENGIRVFAFDVETRSVVLTYVVEVAGSLIGNSPYISVVSPLGGRNKSLELTLNHWVLAEVNGEIQYIPMQNMKDLIINGAEVRLYSLNKDRDDVTASGNILTKDELCESFPATFVEDISFTRDTYIPVVSFDSGGTNFVL